MLEITLPPAALSNIAADRFIDFILLTRFFSLNVSVPLRSHSSVAAYDVLLHYVEEEWSALNRLVPHPVLPPSVRDPSYVYARSPATSTHAAAASTHAAFVAPTCAILSPPQSGNLLQLSDCTRRRPSGSVGTKHFLGPPLPLGLHFSAGCISGHLH